MSEFSNGGFKEAVCIEAMRIFDSCSDKDCLEDLEVTLSAEDQTTVEEANFIKAKCVEVSNVTFAIDPVPFNKGFYTVDITYTFSVDIDAYATATSTPTTVTGTATFNKKVILFGSDGSTKTFSSDDTTTPALVGCGCYSTLPRATVNVVEPIVLEASLKCQFPYNQRPCADYDGQSCTCTLPACPDQSTCTTKRVYITIGMFTIVQLSRPVPMLMPAYDYCIPSKQCSNNTDSPCELFEKIQFPTNEFFPRGLDDDNQNCGCNSNSQDN